MHTFDELLRAFRRQVRLPLRDDAPPSARVWMLWYDRNLEGRVCGQWGQFEHEARSANLEWTEFDAGPLFGSWIDRHEHREILLEEPEELETVLPSFEASVIDALRGRLLSSGPSTLVSVKRCGSLFGFARISRIVSAIENDIEGRLMLSFPGRYDGTGYRLLDARPGWNYHAIPIPPEAA